MAGKVQVKGGGDLDGALFSNAASEETLDAIRKILAKQHGDQDGDKPDDTSGNDAAQKSALGLSKNFEKLKSAGLATVGVGFDVLAGTTENLLKGQYKLTDMSGVVKDAFSGIGASSSVTNKVLGVFGGSIDEATKYLAQTANTYREMSAVGGGLGGDLIELRRAAANTRMPLDEFAGMISQNSERLIALGGNIDLGTKRFAQVSKDFFDSGLGKSSQALGFTFEENNELMMDYMDLNRRDARFKQMTSQQQAASAAKYMKELDGLAKLTGKNRQELQKEANEKARDGQIQASIRLMEKRGIEGAMEQYQAMSKDISAKVGPGFDKMFKTMINLNGAIDPNDSNMVALFNSAPGAAQMFSDAAKSFKAGDFEKANQLQQEAIALAMKRMDSEEFLTISEKGGLYGAVGEVSKDLLQTNQDFLDALTQNSTALGNGATNAQAYADAIKEAEARVRKTQDDAEKSPTMGAVVAAENTIRDGSAALMNSISTEMKAGLEGVFNDIRKSLVGITAKDTQNFMDKLVNVTDINGDSAITLKSMMERIAEDVDASAETKEKAKSIIAQIDEHMKVLHSMSATQLEKEQARAEIEKLRQTTVNDQQTVRETTPTGDVNWFDSLVDTVKGWFSSDDDKDIPKRAGGSIGEAGKLFEDFGKKTIAELHNVQGVFNPDQIAEGQVAYAQSVLETLGLGGGAGKLGNKVQKPMDKPVEGGAVAGASAGNDMTTMFAELRSAIQEPSKELQEMLSTKLDESILTQKQSTQFAKQQVKKLGGLGSNMLRGIG